MTSLQSPKPSPAPTSLPKATRFHRVPRTRSCRITSIPAKVSSPPGRCSACSSASWHVRTSPAPGTASARARDPIARHWGCQRIPAAFLYIRTARRLAAVGVLADWPLRRGPLHRRQRSQRRRDDRVRGNVRLCRPTGPPRRPDHGRRQNLSFQRRELYGIFLLIRLPQPRLPRLPPATGTLIAVNGYTDGVIRAGTAFGQNASGIAPDPSNLYPGLDAFVLVDAAGTPRYPPLAGTDGGTLSVAPLSAAEVQQLLQSALDVANRARAQIRRPLSSQARVYGSRWSTRTVKFSALSGAGMHPCSVPTCHCKRARTAALFSSDTAASFLNALPEVSYLTTTDTPPGIVFSPAVQIPDYVTGLQNFLGNPSALADGLIAFSDRAGGNLSRPFFPDGIDTNGPGPLSKTAGRVESRFRPGCSSTLRITPSCSTCCLQPVRLVLTFLRDARASRWTPEPCRS